MNSALLSLILVWSTYFCFTLKFKSDRHSKAYTLYEKTPESFKIYWVMWVMNVGTIIFPEVTFFLEQFAR